ncbi:phage tail protein [Facklamia sp. P12945]|uniref:phage tail protein n=1 Tax=Facklamia sp. P12945 TaxID=3421950 RepID=UPI003D181020
MLDITIDKFEQLSHYNLCLAERPDIPGAEREIIYHANIDQYDGALTEYGAWKNRQIDLLINILEEGLKPKLREFRGMLLMKQSFTLSFSDDPNFYYIVKGFDLSNIKNEHLLKGEFNIPVVLDPFEYYKFPSTATGTNSIEIRNHGTYFALPIIKLTGTGQIILNINGQIMTIKDLNGQAVIDCEKLEFYDELTPNKRSFKIFTQEFPVMKTGVNKITASGAVTKLSVEFKERYL